MLRVTVLIEGTSEIGQELSAEIVTDDEINVEEAVRKWQGLLTKYSSGWLKAPNTRVELRYREVS